MLFASVQVRTRACERIAKNLMTSSPPSSVTMHHIFDVFVHVEPLEQYFQKLEMMPLSWLKTCPSFLPRAGTGRAP